MNSGNRFNTPGGKKLRREKTLSNHSDSDKDPVQVYCRIRPLVEGYEATSCIKVLSPDALVLCTPENRTIKKEIQFNFKHIFTAFSSQSEVFTHIAYPLLENLLQGKNGLLFTYGVTGSGKTYTLNGDQNDPGILPRCIDIIFNSIGEFQAPRCTIKSDRMNGFEIQSEDDAFHDQLHLVRRNAKVQRKGSAEKINYCNSGARITNIDENSLYSVFISYVEIYNNSVFDLLDDSSVKTLQNKILREDCRKNIYVNGVVENEVISAQEAFELFVAGQNRKRIASTILNSESSRSHSIFNIRVVQLEQGAVNKDGQPTIPTQNQIKVGQLSLVDLAGSERTNRTNNTGKRLKEASSINNSLMTLRTCLEILRENEINNNNRLRLVPYRDSRLTFLFKRFFEGDGSVKMIVCVNPSADDFDENVQVLKFAEMSQDVKIAKAEINKYTPLRKTITRNKESQVPTKLKMTSSFTLLPPISLVKFNLDSVDECRQAIDKVISTLKLRESRGRQLDKEIEEKEHEFRKKLVSFNEKCVLSNPELKSLTAAIQKEKQKAQYVKMIDLEAANQHLRSKNEELQDIISSMKNTIHEKDLKINQYVLDTQRSKQQMGDVWLGHNVTKPCPLGTVMQPTMKKTKSVSKLDNATDITNPK